MDDPPLTIDAREAANNGRWCSSVSPSLRHDILRCAYAKRYKDDFLGASRQRVNQELKAMDREEALRAGTAGLVVRNREALLRISESEIEK